MFAKDGFLWNYYSIIGWCTYVYTGDFEGECYIISFLKGLNDYDFIYWFSLVISIALIFNSIFKY